MLRMRLILLALFLSVGLSAAWPFSRESDQDNSDNSGGEDGQGDYNEVEDEDEEATTTSAPDEAFLSGANRTYTFGECSAYDGHAGHVEMVTSRCGNNRFYYSSVITFRVDNSVYSEPSCDDRRASVVVRPCHLTCLKALDLKEGGSSRANVTILQGGIGHESIKFKVDGELGKGYYYLMRGFTNCTGLVWRKIPSS